MAWELGVGGRGRGCSREEQGPGDPASEPLPLLFQGQPGLPGPPGLPVSVICKGFKGPFGGCRWGGDLQKES